MNLKQRLLLCVTLLVFSLVLAGSAQATVTCIGYYDSRAGSTGGMSFCWLSGSICYDCWYGSGGGGNTCSNDWSPCDPRPVQPVFQTAAFPPSPSEATASTAAIRICEVTSPGPPLRSETLF